MRHQCRCLIRSVVPFGSEGLVEVGEQDGLVVFAETAEEPFDRVFVSVPAESDALARYLPEIPLGPDGLPLAANACRQWLKVMRACWRA